MLITSSRQFFGQRLGLFQIGGVEPLGEPAVDRRERLAGFDAPTSIAAEPGKADSGGAPQPSVRRLGDQVGILGNRVRSPSL
jgi:hypothetical protein